MSSGGWQARERAEERSGAQHSTAARAPSLALSARGRACERWLCASRAMARAVCVSADTARDRSQGQRYVTPAARLCEQVEREGAAQSLAREVFKRGAGLPPFTLPALPFTLPALP